MTQSRCMTDRAASDRIDLHPFTAGDRDWLVAAHGRLYAEEAGFDETFAPVVAGILDDFMADHDPDRERGWIAWRGGAPLGSIFCVDAGGCRARLRLFLLLPEARGDGLGWRMLSTCMDFARAAGYDGMVLSTHESHRAACALYASAGWRLERATPVVHYGQSLVQQDWRFAFG